MAFTQPILPHRSVWLTENSIFNCGRPTVHGSWGGGPVTTGLAQRTKKMSGNRKKNTYSTQLFSCLDMEHTTVAMNLISLPTLYLPLCPEEGSPSFFLKKTKFSLPHHHVLLLPTFRLPLLCKAWHPLSCWQHAHANVQQYWTIFWHFESWLQKQNIPHSYTGGFFKPLKIY